MKSFFKMMLATIVGILLSSILLFFLGIAIISGIVSSSQDKTVTVKPNSVLKITLADPIVDRASNNPLSNFNFSSMENSTKLGLGVILKNIKKAETDDNIKGIYLELDNITGGIATVEEIRNALLEFKKTKKFIMSYSNAYSQKAYYLATVADKIYLHPEGLIDFKGLRADIMFFKGALEKLGVEPQIIRHGKFKSAIEPFILEKMSDANRIQTETYMKSIWNHLLDGISKQRNIDVKTLTMYADSMKMKNAKAALELKFADGLKYQDEIQDELKKLSGTKKKDVTFIGLAKYTNAPDAKKEKDLPKDKIAIIFCQGQIDMGEGDDETIGSDRISKAIHDARLDSSVKAIVLRVNSPGGSALASDIIWREVVLAKKAKPVIASMGDVAASGGYYIACAADRILANPNTITGSIGVFGVLWNGQKLLNDKLGITVDGVSTNTHADIGSVYRPMNNEEKDVIQTEVENVYTVFVNHVSEGRKMTFAQVDSIGQGRVWSGANALDIGLVDEIGGLKRAVEIAAEKAKIKDYKFAIYPKQKDPFEEIINKIMGNEETAVMQKYLGASYKYYLNMNILLKVHGVQALMPFYPEIY